jgi:hypothetical protein
MSARVFFVLTLLILTWVVWLFYTEVNGPRKLSRFEMNQSERMISAIEEAVSKYRSANEGGLPLSPSQLLPYLESVDSLLPITARNRLHIDQIVFWKSPELVDAFGLWAIVGAHLDSVYFIILNPGFFGPRNVVVAKISNERTIKTLRINDLPNWLSEKSFWENGVGVRQ